MGTVVIAIRYISTKLHVLGIEVLKNIHLILNMKPYGVKLIFSLISKEMAWSIFINNKAYRDYIIFLEKDVHLMPAQSIQSLKLCFFHFNTLMKLFIDTTCTFKFIFLRLRSQLSFWSHWIQQVTWKYDANVHKSLIH